MFDDIIFERQKKFYFEKYDLNPKVWEQNRLVAAIAFAVIVTFIFTKVIQVIPNVFVMFLVGGLIFFIMYKYSYVNLTHIDEQVEKYLAVRLPQITTTFVALSAYYDSIVNILDYSIDYVDDKYYTMRIEEFLQKVNNDPEDIDIYIFDLFSNLPSVNALFLSRTMVDLKNKGYDQDLIVSLMKSVNDEADMFVKHKLESIPLEFIKFGTFPIMLTMMIMLLMVMSLMTYAFVGL